MTKEQPLEEVIHYWKRASDNDTNYLYTLSKDNLRALLDAAERSIDLQKKVDYLVANTCDDMDIVEKLEAENKLLREGLELCAYNPATNEQWNSHHQLIQGVQKMQQVARDILDKVKG